MLRSRSFISVVLSILLICTAVSSGFSAKTGSTLTAEESFPAKPDPFVGDWSGTWSQGETKDPHITAQVIALGDDEYQINILPKLYVRCPAYIEVIVKKKGNKLSFKEGDYHGEISGSKFKGGRKPGKGKKKKPAKPGIFEMKKKTLVIPTMGKKPPKGAIVLFNGKNLNEWDAPAEWKILGDGAMMSIPKKKTISSKRKFKDLKMHIEFRTPFLPKERGQGRGNSGVFVQDVFEVQVLDSYALDGFWNECGGLYKVAAPKVNACAPPLHWQAYDITYWAAKFDKSGKKTANPRMTVIHNGMPIHIEQELPYLTSHSQKGRDNPIPKDAGKIKLQAHGNYVQYRNIWVVDMSK